MKVFHHDHEAIAGAGAPESEGTVSVTRARRALEHHRRPRLWRSLEEAANSPEFRQLVDREFPRYAPSDWSDGASRRTFLQLAGASLALAGLTGCTRQPQERIVPYVEQPESLVPGKPLYFATAMHLGGYATGLLAESHMGRPTKLDGNPQHPASLGATDVYAQAEILGLYDPDRSTALLHLGKIRPWETFVTELQPTLQAHEALAGEGIRFLTGATSSPSVLAQFDAVQERFPAARWHRWEPAGRRDVQRGGKTAFGEASETRYDLRRADVVLSLDSDLLASGPGHLAYARQFVERRRLRDGGDAMNRLYVLETTPSPTGTLADHRLPAGAGEIGRFAVALAVALGVPGIASSPELEDETLQRWLTAIADDLRRHRGRSLVVAGDYAAAELHALVQAINDRLGNFGSTVLHTDPVIVDGSEEEHDLARLVADMEAGEVGTLFLLGVNPVFDAPAHLDFAGALSKVNLRVHHGLYRDETAHHCHWHVPAAHFLESWGDGRAFDGTLAITQPLILPLHGGRTDLELLALVAGEQTSDYELVRGTWRRLLGGERRLLGDSRDFEATWREVLHDGLLAGSALPLRQVKVEPSRIAEAGRRLVEAGRSPGAAAGERVDVLFRPDSGVYDGRYANNGWLQELPRPISLLTWDNAALTSPATAERLGLRSEDVVRLMHDERSLELPVLVLPGQAEETITVAIGFGRSRAGRAGDGVGADVGRLRRLERPWRIRGVEVERTGRRYALATTQSHFNIDTQSRQAHDRHLVRSADLDHYREHPDFAQHLGHSVDGSVNMFPRWRYSGYSWGMAIDLGACTGCGICVVACQAENNVPVVGKEQVRNGREMHWLRIDRYYEGDLDHPTVHHQPVTCMHCEQAPCEVVCPVEATVHGPEGLNEMVYNRCVGTRYCSNNCPYKVRRFNFFRYNDNAPVLKMSRNPDVTVRSRGVMEKCTYCVQRINTVRIEAKKERRRIRDGEVRTACQEVCPTGAIVFGDLNDPQSEVNRWKASELDYTLLDELATLPRTSYLAKVKNPNPALAAASVQPRHGSDEH